MKDRPSDAKYAQDHRDRAAFLASPYEALEKHCGRTIEPFLATLQHFSS